MPKNKFASFGQKNEEVEVPTGPDSFIAVVIQRVPHCGNHPENWGETPCYEVEGLTGRLIRGVCDYRAKRAGFNAPINPNSLMRRPFEHK